MSTNGPAYNLSDLRSLFPHTERLTFLNHAGASPLAAPVKAAMVEAVDMTSGDNTGFWPGQSDALAKGLRAKLARLLDADAGEISLTPNTSTALNYVALSLPARPGQNVIVCDKEFPTNVLPWMNLARRNNLELRIVPPDCGGLTVSRLADFADSDTLLVSVSHVQFLTGCRADLEALGAFCHARGILFAVDAIQSAGHIPINVKASHIDFLAAGALKSLMGPMGIGVLYVRRELIEGFDMPVAGASGMAYDDGWCNYKLNFLPGAERYELGTANWVGMAGLDAALDMLQGLEIAHIDAWTTHLSDVLLDDMTRRGFRPLTMRDPMQHGPIVTVAVPGDPQAAFQRLSDNGIAAAVREGHIRLSNHCYNTEEEVLRVGEVLGENGGH